MRNFIYLGAALLVLLGCGEPITLDAGAPDGGGFDGSAALCGADRDCGNQDLFCAQWRCRPGEAGTDSRGCINLGSPCEDGERCDEEMDRCGTTPAWCTEGRDGCLEPGDCDGDGAKAPECGGSDCDDNDGDRFPGNPEICDASGHDEDCNSETVAGPDDGDRDGDGFISALCCNGDNCGDDCDDGLREVFPGAREICNGYDDDCDGRIDEAGVYCPRGVCVDGRCRAQSWMVTLGSDEADDPFGWDFLLAATIAREGTTFVLIQMGRHGDLGGVPVDAGNHLVALGVDGRFLWSRPTNEGRFMVADPSRDAIVIAENSGSTAGQLVWYSTTDGSRLDTPRVALPEGPDYREFNGLALSGSYLAVAWTETTAGSDAYAHIWHVTWDGVLVNEWVSDANQHMTMRGLNANDAGAVVFITNHELPLSIGGSTLAPGTSLVQLDALLSPMWGQAVPELTRSAAIANDGRIAYAAAGAAKLLRSDRTVERSFEPGAHVVYRTTGFDGRGGWFLGGVFSGAFDAGRGPVTAEGGNDGFLSLFDMETGHPINSHVLTGRGQLDVVTGDVDGYGGVLIAGSFHDEVVFGTHRFTSRGGPNGVDVFVARLSD